MSSVAVIPARGGSKRIPRKNIKLLGELPLLVYTLKAALEADCFEQVIVSTDDAEIADIAEQQGASIFLRAAALADDYTPVSLVTLNVLEQLNDAYDCVAQLMPNCPFRNSEDIKASFKQFKESQTDSQLSVTRYGWLNPWWAHKYNNETLEPLFKDALLTRSQDLAELVCPSGAIWWAKTAVLKTYKTFYAPSYAGFVLPWERALDIDDESDWKLAQALLMMQDL